MVRAIGEREEKCGGTKEGKWKKDVDKQKRGEGREVWKNRRGKGRVRKQLESNKA